MISDDQATVQCDRMANGQTVGVTYTDSHGVIRRIDPAHVRALAKRGITVATIRAYGIYSETSCEAVKSILRSNVLRPRNMPCIVIPFGGDYSRVRPDNPRYSKDKPVKYESPRELPSRVYVPPGVEKYAEDVEQELIITEGEFKAIAATQEGFPCLGLVGVDNWHAKKREELCHCLTKFKLKGRKVYIAFDSDRERKKQVDDNARRLAKALHDAGAIVQDIHIPDGPPDAEGNATKQGLDDYLVANWGDHKKLLRKLLDEATEPKPVDGGKKLENASKADPAAEAAVMLCADERDGAYTLRWHRDGFYRWHKGRYEHIPTGDVRAGVVTVLNRDYQFLTTGVVANVIQQLQAQSFLSSKIEFPCWLPGKDAKWDPPADWKARDLLSFPNGILHLPSGEFLPRITPRLFTPTALDFDYNANAGPPTRWLEFLAQCWGVDIASIELLQEWFGYVLSLDTSLQKMLLLVGPKRSGKGTIARVVAGIVGSQNIAAPTLAGLATNFGLQSLIGKTVGIVGDARLSGRTDQAIVTERLLSITGEDAITIDRKNQSAVTMKLLTRLMVLTNELPRLNDSSGALASRFLVLQLTQSHYGNEDNQLTDKLLAERGSILQWAIEGWRRLQARGRFVEPESGNDLREQLDDLSSPVGAFVRETCEVGPGYAVQVGHLFDAWKAWCESKGREPGNEQTFGRDIRAVVSAVKSRQLRTEGERHRFFEGIGLREPFRHAVSRVTEHCTSNKGQSF